MGTAASAEAQTFTGYLNLNTHPTDLIPITLTNDGSLNLQITVGELLNLNANASVGVSQGVIVYDSTGTNQLFAKSQGQATTQTHVVNGLGAGSYMVRLTAIGNFEGLGWGNYTMIASETPDPLANDPEINDDFDRAMTASLNAEVMGHLGYLGPASVIENQDYWQVSLPTDGTLQLDIATGAHLNLNRNSDLGTSGGVIVYDANRTSYFYSASQGQNTINMHVVPKLKAGVYYVRLIVLGPDRAYYGSYRMTARHTPESVANDAEPNDQSTQHGLLALDTPVTGHLGYYGGGAGTDTDVQDWWRVTLPQAGNLDIEVATSPLLNLNANATIGAASGITVYDSDAATVLYGATQAPNLTDTHSALGLKPGVYYVRLTKIDRADYYGSYRLTPRLVSVPEDTESNDDAANASLVALGSTVQGNLGYRGGGLGLIRDQLDWWQFSMPSTGQVQLVITTYGILNLNANTGLSVSEGITVFGSTGGAVGARLFGTSQGQGTTRTYPLNLPAGNYYLRLVKLGTDAYWGTYSTTLNYVGAPIINSPTTAHGLTGQSFNYTITALGGGEFGASGLPEGLTVNQGSGLISGTLGSPATHNVTLLATNASGTASAALTLTVMPLPALSIHAVAGSQVVITWSADYADSSLLTAPAVNGSPTWTTVTPAPVASGNIFTVTNAVDNAPRFYRLKQD